MPITEQERLRDKAGRFVSRQCPDPNCGGELVYETDRWFGSRLVCNGLTHDTEDGPLRACDFSLDSITEKDSSNGG